MNVGVIGAGLMGSTHARLLATAVSGADVVAISDAAARERGALAEELGVGTIHADGLELIANPVVDAVVDRLAGSDPRAVRARLPRGRQAGAVREAARGLRRGRAADRRGRDRARPPARDGRVHAPLRPRLRGHEGAPGRGRDRRAAARPLRAPQPERPLVLRLGDDHHRYRGPRDRHHALAAGRGDHPRDGADAALVFPCARGAARPAAAAARTSGGQIVDVEAFVSAGYAYDIRCEIVGEDGTLELLPPATVSVRAAIAEPLAIPPTSASASASPT